MEREALLLYLRNVRDLEVAKYCVRKEWNRQKNIYEKNKEKLQITNYKSHWHVDTENVLEWFLAADVCVGIFAIGIPIANWTSGFWIFSGFFTNVVRAIQLICGIVVLAFVIIVFRKIGEYFDNKKVNKEIDKYNEREAVREQENKKKIANLTQNWEKKSKYLKNEEKKVIELLKKFYGMNILASQYRNLTAVYYIYDYMSTSQATLEDTLFHEHMEDGITRLERKIDQLASQVGDLIYETRCARQNTEKSIAQNEKMLMSLQQTEQNTLDAARYAELSANYSEANAYFELANYLQNSKR